MDEGTGNKFLVEAFKPVASLPILSFSLLEVRAYGTGVAEGNMSASHLWQF